MAVLELVEISHCHLIFWFQFFSSLGLKMADRALTLKITVSELAFAPTFAPTRKITVPEDCIYSICEVISFVRKLVTVTSNLKEGSINWNVS